MTKDAVEKIWKDYLKSYSDVSSDERQQLLQATVSEDIISSNPGEESRGLEAVIAHVNQFQQRMPGAYFTLNKLFFHHDQVLAEWTLFKSDATPLRTAYTYGLFNDQAKLKQLTGFF